MLASVRNEYRSDVVKYTVSAVCAVLEKFDMGCVPREVLYKLLLCVAKCLVLLVEYWVAYHHQRRLRVVAGAKGRRSNCSW